jgi:hypothetical protein
MIHAFLITIAVIAAIYAWPFILLGLWVCFKILTSKWFWLGILGFTLFIISCYFLGATTFLILGGAYMTWRLMAWGELLKSRKTHKAEILRSNKSLPQQESPGDILMNFFDPGPGFLLPDRRTVSKVPACGNETNRSDEIDWSKLQRQPEQRPREFIGFN